MPDTVFTKMINGQIPCHKIYEDQTTLAFLDIRPHQPGHTLVIPKKPAQFVWDLEEADYLALMNTVKKVATRIREVMGSTYVGELISGIDVAHTHVHLVPFSNQGEFPTSPPETDPPTYEQLAEIAKKLAF